MKQESKSPRDGIAGRMLDVAVARIRDEGMSVSLDRIGMEAVIKEAGVSRASAYRRWPSREDFLADVLVETVRSTSLIPETESEVSQLVGPIAQHADRLSTAQGRRDLVVEGLRVSVDADVRRIAASPAWRTYLALSAAYPGLPEGSVRDQVRDALAETEAGFTERRAAIYANLAALIGYRLAPGLQSDTGFRHLSVAAGTLMTGLVVRTLRQPEWLDEREEATLFGASAPAPWSSAERQVVGLLFSHLEPDPDVDWSEASIEATRARFAAQVEELFARAGRANGPGEVQSSSS